MNKEYIQTGRTNQKLETRDKILKSAQYFLKKGKGFNLEDVAKKSGVSRATIYRYYSNVEILTTEASLDINTLDSEVILERYQDKSLKDKVMGIQEYFNELSLDNEPLFRRYLSAVIVPTTHKSVRGARRIKALRLALEKEDIAPKQKEDLANLLTLFMGIEPMIVAKDVANLDNRESIRLLKWGLELVLKGYLTS
ncbi:TetR/AcrR family transcriptional regulator [Flagellimonas algicola]|uniref:TetR/AcrR family transcriptional regulator n=1 Tax=Flagellimonas algicola TaxID=2583815 RepID=A0ABY2WN27_9FLAO|nr:TetR/AcrR family transcriptional regulator [Allomuricauda algicola]TMU56067.1 TetR/AcrR family transcriptional regulator [Allomuricauda algicola]